MLLHRWPALILGLFLVVECTSGAVLLYNSEIFRATNGNLYHHTASANPIAPERAIDIVKQTHPDFDAIWVAKDAGVFVVGDPSYQTQWFVDPGTGHINGLGSTNGGFMGLMVNIHDCAFTCEGYPGYNSWFGVELWAGGPTFLNGITRAAFILGVLGLLMVLLVLTSLKIWWPGIKRIKQRFLVRRGRGRFARDYDLHNVIGAIALPFLLMWGITGAALEFPAVKNAWLAITAGEQEHEEAFFLEPNPAPANAPTITVDQATSTALAAVPGSKVSFIGLPSKDFDNYEIDVVSSYKSDAHRAIYSGDAYVLVDPHDATHFKVISGGEGPVSNRFYDKFLEPTHFGWNVNVWWRSIWLVFGLAPLALMITGLSTWLFRRGIKKRRKQSGQEKLRDTQLDPDHIGRGGDPDPSDPDPGAAESSGDDDDDDDDGDDDDEASAPSDRLPAP